MNNITLSSMLNEFSEKNLLDEKDSLRFEKLVIYSLLANDYYDSFDQDKLGTGECIGVDAVAISINDVLTYSEQEARQNTNGQLDVCFSFIQAKTSQNLDLGDYLKFLQTINLFFKGTEQEQPEQLKEAFRIKDIIYGKASRFRDYPHLEINYVYCGTGTIEDKQFCNQINGLVNEIKQIPYYFSNVDSYLIGANKLAERYKETLNRTTKKLQLYRHVALPKISSAKSVYLGVAKCLDYIELLKNNNGQINKGVFYDNVRDYLGSTNPVNTEIEQTIKSTVNRNQFSVLNNGVTVVAKKVTPGDTFEISGFQVVNGCQTSHVLFNNKDAVTDDMYITVKLIETDDVNLSNSVIQATNSQSIVTKEAFSTIKPYHKRLEEFFKAMNKNGYRIFYERRPHQFDEDDLIKNSEIASAPLLIKSFVSVVLEAPHQVHYYYGQILQEYNTDKSTLLFEENHHPGLYFISQLIASKARDIAAKNKLGTWSYHAALLIKKRLGISLNIHDKLNDASVLEMISKIDSGFTQAANDAIYIIKNARLAKNDHMIPEKTRELTKSLFITYPAKNTLDSSSSTCTLVRDGVYVVKNLVLSGNDICFQYGKSKFQLPKQAQVSLNKKLERATITVANGHISSLEG